jgi:putative methionine-R-sulfoxide reductase with GAF domain
MKMTVTCGVCNKELAVIEKDDVTDDDKTMYQNNTSCDADAQTNIVVTVTSE